ncbi:MAG: DNA N-6-adenine-methyltransferase [Nostoc sp.]
MPNVGAAVMTTVAPNLGKLFNSRTSRPATPEDIALLASGDWISEKDCPWSWQFKNSCQDMAIGVWEGKEFFVPHHLLMVCEIIEGQVVEKFFKKPEADYAELKVGDRFKSLQANIKSPPVQPLRSTESNSLRSGGEMEADNSISDPRYVGDVFGRNFCERFKIGDRFASKSVKFCIVAVRDGKKSYQIRWDVTPANPTGSKEWVDLKFLCKCEPLIVSGLPKHKFQAGDKVRILNANFGTHGQIATVIALRAYGLVFTDEPLLSLYHQKCLEKLENEVEGIGNKGNNDSHSSPHLPISRSKESDKWYTPPKIEDLVILVLGAIDLDPCADDGKHIKATNHLTAADDGLSLEWRGRVFMNPPYSCPGKWIAKLQTEYESGRVSEAIALVPAATDTNWLSPLLASQPVCFWKGRIKFLDTNYQPKQSARQSHCLVYWGANQQKFKQVFDEVGVVKNVDSWNPADFGKVPHQIEASGQTTIFFDDSNEPPEPDDFDTVEEFEEAWKQWEKVKCTSLVDTFLVGHPAIPKAQLPQDTDQCGQSKTIPSPRLCTENDFQILNSSNKTLPPLATNLSGISPPQTLSFSQHLALTFPWLENEPELMELAEVCFLRDSDGLESSAHLHSSLKMSVVSLAQTKGLPSRKSSKRLQVWGIAAPGNLGMAIGTSPKTENEFSSWAITAEVRATQPKIGKKSLQEIFNGESTAVLACSQDEQVANPKGVNSVTGEEIDEAFTLTASTPKLGAGNKSHPNTFVSIPVKVYVDGVAEATESPALCSGGWQHRSPLHRDKRGADARRLANASLSFAVLYRAAGGDRLYHEQSPCLRSPNNSGTGAYKIREYQGETYLERPINATEAEQLMGWEVGSTAIGINKEGDEATISQTQRIKMIGNGIIPAEITDILTAIKPMLERKLESEVPENMRFAYRQLRQKGMSHQDAMHCLLPN